MQMLTTPTTSTIDPKLYTLSKNARPDTDGSYKLLFSKAAITTLVKRIQSGLIGAIGSVNQNLTLQWIVCPQVYFDTDGNPTHIVGNMSNKMDTFGLLKISIEEAVKYFGVIYYDENAPEDVKGTAKLAPEDLVDTRWAQATIDEAQRKDTTVCALSRVFCVWFGSDLPRGSLLNEDVRAAFGELGDGYDTWAQVAVAWKETTSVNLRENTKVLKKVMAKVTGLETHVHPEFADEELRELSLAGPAVAVDLIEDEDAPDEAKRIRASFQPKQSAVPGIPSGEVLVRTADEREKKSVADENVAKLGNFLLGGKINFDTCTIDTPVRAIWSKGFKQVLDGPTKTMAARLQSLLIKAVNIAQEVDIMNTYADTTMEVFQRQLATLMLGGEFSTVPLVSVVGETNSVSFDAFLPQFHGDTLTMEVVEREQRYTNERLMDMKSTLSKATIARLGRIKSYGDVLAGIKNINNCIRAIIDEQAMVAAGGEPIFFQLADKYLRFYLRGDVRRWTSLNAGTMTNHAFNMLSDVDAIMSTISRGALDFGNVSVSVNNEPVGTIALKEYVNGVRIFNAFDLGMQNKVIRNHPDDNRSPLYRGLSEEEFVPELAISPHCGKRDSAGNNKKDKSKDKSKDDNKDSYKKREDDKNDTPNTQKGFIHLKNANDATQIFPVLTKKICPDFACQGRECKVPQSECRKGKHVYRPDMIEVGDLNSIGDHFIANGHAWFNANTVKKSRKWTYDPKYKAVMGNKNGPGKGM